MAHRVDGFIITPVRTTCTAFLSQFARSDLPIVTIDSYHDLPVPDISVDREHGGYLQVKHMIDIGRRKLAFLIPDLVKWNYTMQARVRGYRRACQDFGMNFDDQLLIMDPHPDAISLALGAKLTRQALETGRDFDAIIASNDQLACGATMVLQQTGRRVPDDVAVIGFDDEPMAGQWSIPLTTIRQPREVGRLAVEMLIRRIEAGRLSTGDSPGRRERVLLKPSLLVRASTVVQADRAKDMDNPAEPRRPR